MKTLLTKFLAAAALLFLAGVGDLQAQDKTAQLAIIAGKSSVLDDVSTVMLQKYFKAEKSKTPDGTKIVVVMIDLGHAERDAALHDIYKMSEAEYNDYFVGQTFTGAVQSAPKSFSSVAAVKAYVAQTPGALGYVRASEADDSVKVLKVDGKSPGDADYSLKL